MKVLSVLSLSIASCAALPLPPIHYDAAALVETWSRVRAGDAELMPALTARVAAANASLTAGPFSVMQSAHLPPSGDPHDYCSVGVYWWPCSAVGPAQCVCSPATGHCTVTTPTCNLATQLPWMSCDGHINREAVDGYDEPKIASLAAAVDSLAKGFYWTRNEAFAQHAAALVRAWFITPSTRMNPNLNYGQSFPGVADNGTFSGLIETDGNFIAILDGLSLITLPAPCHAPPAPLCPGSPAWSDADASALAAWLTEWDAWLASSPFSQQAGTFFNNHNTWLRAAWSSVAITTRNWSRGVSVLNGAKSAENAPICKQIWGTGELPGEAGRANSIGYTIMDLQGLLHLGMAAAYPPFVAAVGEGAVGDLWTFVCATGEGGGGSNHSSIRAALAYIAPFAAGKEPWPHATEPGTTDFRGAFSILRQAAYVLRDPSFAAIADALPGDHAAEEARLWWPVIV